MDGASGETITNGQGMVAEKNIIVGPKDAAVDTMMGDTLALGAGGGEIPRQPLDTRHRVGDARDSPYQLGEPTHAHGWVWHRLPGRRESDWFLRESEEEDEMPRDDYRCTSKTKQKRK
uniref:Uncharacterized protein n=1 Tax=Sphaerodactylus townsendi TaxID=933632 RepID=A0ACB8FC93_9SAUR